MPFFTFKDQAVIGGVHPAPFVKITHEFKQHESMANSLVKNMVSRDFAMAQQRNIHYKYIAITDSNRFENLKNADITLV
jgi:hypothetical protein